MVSLAGFEAFATRRFRARALLSADAEAVRALTDDPAITAMVDFLATPFTIDDARDLIAGQDEGNRFFGVREPEGLLVAVAGAHVQQSGRVEIGYWVGSAFHGRGYASEIAQSLVREISVRFPGQRIVAECRPENAASWAVLRKCGFVPSGRSGHRAGRQLLMLPS